MPSACASCDSPLDGRRRHARYCSGACRAAASRERFCALSSVGGRNGSRPPKKAHESAHSGPWVLPRDADDLIAALLETFPASYELTNDGSRVVARTHGTGR